MLVDLLITVAVAAIVGFFTFCFLVVPTVALIENDLGFILFAYRELFIGTFKHFYNSLEEKFSEETIDDLIEEKYTEKQIKETKVGMERDMISEDEKSVEETFNALWWMN